MAFGHVFSVVDAARSAAGGDLARVGPQAHCSALLADAPLMFHQVNHLVFRFVVKFAAGGVGQAADVAGKLDHRTLQTKAYAEKRDAAFPDMSDRRNLSFNAPFATRAVGAKKAPAKKAAVSTP